MYVTDEWLNRVSVFDTEGNFVSCWHTVQSGDSEPNGAAGIAIDANNTLYVTGGKPYFRRLKQFVEDVTG